MDYLKWGKKCNPGCQILWSVQLCPSLPFMPYPSHLCPSCQSALLPSQQPCLQWEPSLPVTGSLLLPLVPLPNSMGHGAEFLLHATALSRRFTPKVCSSNSRCRSRVRIFAWESSVRKGNAVQKIMLSQDSDVNGFSIQKQANAHTSGSWPSARMCTTAPSHTLQPCSSNFHSLQMATFLN